MQTQPDQSNLIARIQRGSALFGGMCLIAAASCASSHTNERGDATARARSHEAHRDARYDHDHDHDGVVHDRDGRVVRDRDGVVRDRDGRVVRDSDGVRAQDVAARDSAINIKPVPIADVHDGTPAGAPSAADTDAQLSARIRKSIVADDTLSTNAKNVKITSNKDAVILRGPVPTLEEKSRVESHAQHEAGTRHVDNQLQVTR